MAAKEKKAGAHTREIKCLAECPRCGAHGAGALCGLDTGHTSGHRCNRCSNVWK